MLNKQVYIHSVETRSFYSPEEESIRINIIVLNAKIKTIKQYRLLQLFKDENNNIDKEIIEKQKKLLHYFEGKFKNINEFIKEKKSDKDFKYNVNKLYRKNKKILKSKEFKDTLKSKGNYRYKKYNNQLKQQNKKLRDLLEVNDVVRKLNPNKLSKYNIVAVFDSYLTRALNLEVNKVSTDLFIIEVFHYSVFKQLVENGFTYLNERYVFFTASAGQIRNKRILMIKQKIFDQYANTLMCGLTIEEINNKTFEIDGVVYKGCNINKYLSYLALCTGATDKWEKFDIDRAIVIDDFETEVKGEVDFVDNETFIATRKTMNIPIVHSDGCAWILPSESRKNFMVRLPWLKGLVVPCNFISYCDIYNNGNYKVTDIYGKEWDLKADDIRYVFSRSQFKMAKYYSSWEHYKEKFKKFNCHASICNVEPNANKFKNKSVPYQMWQTLVDITDDDIEYLTDHIFNYLIGASTNRDCMLDILGINNENKTYLQQALTIYPEMLKEPHVQQELSNVINSMKNEAKYGCFELGDNAKYTFLLPDIFAWLEYSLGGNKNPKGLLEDGEVSCRLHKDEEEICVNRNPHLYREWAVRKNIVDYTNENWFITNGVYVSCHDLISKLIMNDWDGDTALVIKGKLVEIAKRNMKGIVPLFYEMGVARPEIINNENIYNSLVTAFKYSNIGKYSNKLTKLWNNKNPDLEVAKAIVSMNNFSIDAAKTLIMPKVEGEMAERMQNIDNIKMPYFFQFVKKEYKDNVEEINDSTVNKICKEIESIPRPRYNFCQIGTFRYDNLLKNKKIKINQIVIDEYERLNKEMQKYFYKNNAMSKEELSKCIWDILSYEFRLFCDNEDIKYEDAVDMVIRHIYKTDRFCRKEFLFNVLGDVIVTNIINNIGLDSMICSKCNKRIKRTSNRQTMCSDCADKVKKERAKTGMRKLRKKKAS